MPLAGRPWRSTTWPPAKGSVARHREAAPPRDRLRRLDQPRRRAGSVAVADHDIGLARAARRHRMAVEQQHVAPRVGERRRAASPARRDRGGGPAASRRSSSASSIGARHKRAEPGQPRRDQPQAGARARGRRLAAATGDRGGIKLVGGAIDVDHRARRARDDRADAAIDRARDEPVDERILEPFEARLAEPRRAPAGPADSRARCAEPTAGSGRRARR